MYIDETTQTTIDTLFTPVFDGEFITIYKTNAEVFESEYNDPIDGEVDIGDQYLNFFMEQMGGVTQQWHNVFGYLLSVNGQQVGVKNPFPMAEWGFALVKKDFEAASGETVKAETMIPLPFFLQEIDLGHKYDKHIVLDGIYASLWASIVAYNTLCWTDEDQCHSFFMSNRMAGQTPQMYAAYYNLLSHSYLMDSEEAYEAGDKAKKDAYSSLWIALD